MLKTIRRNATRQLAALRESHTVAHVFRLDSGFNAIEIEPRHAWDALERFDFSRVTLTDNGGRDVEHVVIRIHDNLWYELREPVATVWVKSTSHRSRHRVEQACVSNGHRKPQPWFRRSARGFRTNDEYFELPADVDVSRIKGVTVLAHPLTWEERIRPW